MIVLKFGGTSLGSAERMKHVAGLVTRINEPLIVVLSAISGTTNALEEITNIFSRGESSDKQIQTLHIHYRNYLQELVESENGKEKCKRVLDRNFQLIESLVQSKYSSQKAKELLSIGEIISTSLFQVYLEEIGIQSTFLLAVDFMRLSVNGEPDLEWISSELERLMKNHPSRTYITQGFICKNAEGLVDNLQRGGSDYSATLIGAAINAKEVQIWTDIDGMHNNDPRIVERTTPISELSFEEASELAYFGAKILHPYCIIPAQKHEIPVRIKNTLKPDAPGTYITRAQNHQRIKAIAAKDGITAIKIKSSRMINAYGFLRRVFEVFEKYETSIDMITTSEIAISLTIDNPSNLAKIVEELNSYGKVEVDENQTIICIVGDLVAENTGVGKIIFTALENIPVRMVSYGGSRNNISILVDNSVKKDTLMSLNKILFNL